MSGIRQVVGTLLAVLGFVGLVAGLPDELTGLFSDWSNHFKWVFLLLCLAFWFRYKYPLYISWDGFKHLFRIGVSWKNRESFLGMNGSANPLDTRITGFQLHGFNNSRQTMETVHAKLFLPDGREVPLLVTTSDGSMDHAVNVDITPRTKFYINGQFGKLKPDEFIAGYVPLRLELTWRKGNLVLKFSKRMAERHIHRFESGNIPKPDSL